MNTAKPDYSNTPHKTISDLAAIATSRTIAGERPSDVIKDLVEGYNLGWQSANHRIIEAAAKALGFKSDQEAEAHEKWLWKNGTQEFRNWLRGVNPEKARMLELITKGELTA